VEDVSRRLWPGPRRGQAPPEGAVETMASLEEINPFPAESEPPGTDEPPRPRINLAAFRLAALGLALVLTLSLTMVRLFVGGPPSVEELRRQAGVDNWSELAIGVKDDQPGTAVYNKDGTWSGFDIDIAYMIAEDLGFRRGEVKFFAMESEDRVRMQATDTDRRRVPVKLVIASYSITDEREAKTGVTFSAPYLYTEQSVLTVENYPKVSALEDLKDLEVCTLSASTSQAALEEAGAIVRRKNRVSECIDDLRTRNVDAVSTDAAILAGFKAAEPDVFAHYDLGLDVTEAWGVNVGENEALKKLVDLTLYRSLKDPADDRWEVAYERNLQSEQPANGPTPIAQAQRPDARKPDVKEQPWETVVP
jgi:glutamate transport system substrate-binding protein